MRPPYARTVSMSELRRLDLNLVLALHALLVERNVSIAAERLGVSQSAASQSLAKLRRHFDDPLLRRVGRQYQLTSLATELKPRVEEVVHGLGDVLRTDADFDPRATEREFVVSMSDYAAAVLGGPLVTSLAQTAPGARLRFDPMPEPGLDVLKETIRHCDGVVAPRSETPPGPDVPLFSDEWCCIVDSALAQEASGWSTDDFTSRGWVGTSFYGIVPGQDFMRRAGIEVDVVVRAPTFSAVPYLVAGTPHVGVMHRRLAEQLGQSVDVTIVPTPWPPPPVHMVLFYDAERAQQPAARWFVDWVEHVAEDLGRRS